MREDKSMLMVGAMRFGLSMGIYWLVKYVFFMFSIRWAGMSIIFWALTIAVPFIAYQMTKRYREEIGGSISFFHAWSFGTLLYFFAALILSIEAYIFYRYVASPDYISNAMKQTLDLLRQTNLKPETIEQFSTMNFTPITMAIQGIFNNTFYGVIFSIPVAALLCKNNYTGTIDDRDKH